MYETKRAKEHSFRYGRNQSTNTLTTNANTFTGTGTAVPAPSLSQSQLTSVAPNNATKAQTKWKTVNGSQVGVGGGSTITHVTTPPNSPGLTVTVEASGSGSSTTEKEGTVRSDTGLISRAPRPLPPPPTFAFLSNAPISMFNRAGKGDADSLRTDFLQV